MEIRCPQISGFVDYCSLSVHSQRQRPCLENASQCCCACGLSRGASSIGELRRRAGRSMHSSPASGRKRVFRPPFHRVCPSGQVQLWHLVKVVRVVCGKKTKAEAWPQELNWWSFSVNPTPTGKQFIVQPQSQWERDRERQQAKEGSAPPQPVPAATSAAAPPAAPPAAAAAPAAAPQAHPQHQQVQQPQPNESPEGWTRVGKGGMPDRFTMRNHGRKPPGKAVKRKPDRQPARK